MSYCGNSSGSGTSTGTAEDGANYKLVIASSADYTSNAHVFCGPDVRAWKDCNIPGQLFINSVTVV